MTVSTETATVYRGGGRRWFTKLAACRAEARARIRERCECEAGCPVTGYPDYVCDYHYDMDRYSVLVYRMARFYARKIEATHD